MQRAHLYGGRKSIDGGNARVGIDQIRPEPAASLAQSLRFLFGKRRSVLGGKRHVIVEPSVLRGSRDDELRKLLRAHGHTVHNDVCELRGGNFIDPPVERNQLAVSPVDGARRGGNFPLRDLGIQLRDLVLDSFDGCLKLSHALTVACEQCHR